jgi:dihydrofolate reductase
VGKLITSTFVSIDNMMVGPNEDMSWVLDNFDPEMGADQDAEAMGSMAAILIGRTTYEIMIQHWPKVTEAESPGADGMNHTPKLVFSRSLEKADWGTYGNATVVPEIDPAEIERRKREADGDLVVMGSASLVQQLTSLGLIDEYVLWVHPVILGEGAKPLFKGVGGRHNLSVLKTKTYKSGAMLIRLRRQS